VVTVYIVNLCSIALSKAFGKLMNHCGLFFKVNEEASDELKQSDTSTKQTQSLEETAGDIAPFSSPALHPSLCHTLTLHHVKPVQNTNISYGLHHAIVTRYSEHSVLWSKFMVVDSRVHPYVWHQNMVPADDSGNSTSRLRCHNSE